MKVKYNNQLYKVMFNKEFKQKTQNHINSLYWEDDYIVRLIIEDFPNYKGILFCPKGYTTEFEIINESF